MKKILSTLILALGLCVLAAVPPSYGDGDKEKDHKGWDKDHKGWDKDKDHDGCKDKGDGKKNDCFQNADPNNATVPEPGSLALLAAGIALGGAVLILNRKRSLPS